MKNSARINDMITAALAIEAEEAKEAGRLGFMCRSLVQATLPHRKVDGNEFVRTNGDFTLTLLAPSKVGLPYGSIPRLLIAWLATEAVKTKEREIVLGDSLSSFMRQIGLSPTGGAKGDITRLKEQSRRLFGCFITCSYTDINREQRKNILIADDTNLWWEPKNPDQLSLFASTITLSQPFFDEITQHPVPIDLRAIGALKQSPMALDIYTWLTYRNSYLRNTTVIPWEALKMQFGADYKLTKHFREAFLLNLNKVVKFYPEAKVSEHDNGLLLKPSPTHVVALNA